MRLHLIFIILSILIQCSLVNFAKDGLDKKENNTSLPLLYGLLLAGGGASNTTSLTTLWRVSPTATSLPNGQVLIAGGGNPNPSSSAELFDPATNTFSRTGDMNDTREKFTATLMADGKVLMTGGTTSQTTSILSTAELYDSGAGIFTRTGNMSTIKYGHSAVLMNSGKVLIGDTSPEIYDPNTRFFSSLGINLFPFFIEPKAILLNSGKILLLSSGSPAASYLFDSSTNTLTSIGSMIYCRYYFTATLLQNGKVLITGGSCPSSASSTAETFDPNTGLFSITGKMNQTRESHTATLLSDGKVLIAGGGHHHTSVEIYDPNSGTFTLAGTSMKASRSLHTATLLKNGKVLLVGGNLPLASYPNAELYSP